MWANIVKQAPAPAAPDAAPFTSADGCKVVVVDANAIINGIRLEGIADKAVTIQDVLEEVRDKQARQFLASLATRLEVAEPSDESLKAVTRFARETGDIHALSTVDVRLLALAHTLEVATHGAAHIKQHPSQPVLRTRHRASGKALPGWGRVENPEDWRVVDEANDDDAAAGAGASRIATSVQALALDGALAGQAVGALADSAAAEGPSAGAGSSAPAQALAAQQQRREQEQAPKERPPGAANGAAPSDDSDSGDEGADGGDDGWEMASKSQGAARRRRRKELRRQQRQAEFESEWQEHSQLMQEQREQQQQQGAGPMEGDSGEEGDEAGAEQLEPEQLYGPAGVFAADEEEEGEEEEGEEGGSAQQEEGEEGEEGEPQQEQEQEQEQEQAGAAGSAAGASAAADRATTAAWDAPPGGASSSSVATMTADFAMQNVLLQMGLRLLSRDGRVVTKLSRWALRCSACFFVTREAGRLFCPKCGNMSLDKVEVTVGPDGSEFFGVRKRHILRGTRFSLPKPKGGRNRTDPILREDVFLIKVKALGGLKKKAPAPPKDGADADPFGDGEFAAGRSQAALAQHRGLAAVLEPAWKHNPNERKLTRSNRRK